MGLASQLLLGNVSPSGATELKSFRTTVASLLSNTFLIGGSVAISIHIVLTFFRMHGLALTLAFVVFWLIWLFYDVFSFIKSLFTCFTQCLSFVFAVSQRYEVFFTLASCF